MWVLINENTEIVSQHVEIDVANWLSKFVSVQCVTSEFHPSSSSSLVKTEPTEERSLLSELRRFRLALRDGSSSATISTAYETLSDLFGRFAI
jgi:hypothetical protein